MDARDPDRYYTLWSTRNIPKFEERLMAHSPKNGAGAEAHRRMPPVLADALTEAQQQAGARKR